MGDLVGLAPRAPRAGVDGAVHGAMSVTEALGSAWKLGVTRKSMDPALNVMAVLLNLMTPAEIGSRRD